MTTTKTKQIIVVFQVDKDHPDTEKSTIAEAITQQFPQFKHIHVWDSLGQFLIELAPPNVIQGMEDSLDEDSDDPHYIHTPTRQWPH